MAAQKPATKWFKTRVRLARWEDNGTRYANYPEGSRIECTEEEEARWGDALIPIGKSDKSARELISDIAGMDASEAAAVVAAEDASDKPRTSVIEAAKRRIADLAEGNTAG